MVVWQGNGRWQNYGQLYWWARTVFPINYFLSPLWGLMICFFSLSIWLSSCIDVACTSISTMFCAQDSNVTIILDFCALPYHPHPAPSTDEFHLPAVSWSFPVFTIIAAAPAQVPAISPGPLQHTANQSPSVSLFKLLATWSSQWSF